jgi:soluble lytic murein transglycosylase-like protein
MNNLKFLAMATIGLVVMVSMTDDKTEEETYTLRDMEPVSSTDPPCIQMYYYIEQYADSFNIPKRYAYGIANAETGYKGPFHWRYNPAQTSCVGAVGPMQIMLATARFINRDGVSKDKLKSNIQYNVFTSMKLLRRLYNKYGNWKTVFGAYNTGRPCVNGYAVMVYNYKRTHAYI